MDEGKNTPDLLYFSLFFVPVDNFISLSELTGQIKSVLTNAFFNKSYWVVADVIDHKYYTQKGYHYFCLVEKSKESQAVLAKIQAVAWGNGATSIQSFEHVTGQKFRNDIHVLANVSVSYHSAYGLQLVLNDIDTTFTIGQLEQQRQHTLQRLLLECSDFIQKVGDNYITRNSRLQLKQVIQTIAVVTSSNAAGYKDFADTIEKNKFGYKITIDPYFTLVQGEANVEAIYNRLLDVYKSGKAYDAVVIIRGGGSQLDFLIFDQYKLAKAVAKFPIPIISGIGHQINETIVDLMSHTSVKTPSIAAEFIISHNRQFEEGVMNFQKLIIIKSQQLFNSKQKYLSQTASTLINSTRNILQLNKDGIVKANQIAINKTKSLLFDQKTLLNELSGRLSSKPKITVSNKLNDLANLVQNLKSFSKKYTVNQRGYLGHYESICKLMSPVNILKKGFAVVYLNDKIVVNGSTIKESDKLKIRLSESEITASVTTNKKLNGINNDL